LRVAQIFSDKRRQRQTNGGDLTDETGQRQLANTSSKQSFFLVLGGKSKQIGLDFFGILWNPF